MRVFIYQRSQTLSGTTLGQRDINIKWANQMIETHVKVLSFARKYYKRKN